MLFRSLQEGRSRVGDEQAVDGGRAVVNREKTLQGNTRIALHGERPMVGEEYAVGDGQREVERE